MKKLLAALCGCGFLLAPMPVSYAHAPGVPEGWVLYSDITTYIDGDPIRSYNIDGNTYVVAEDLMEYGFRVDWIESQNGTPNRLKIGERTGVAAPDYVPAKSPYPSGTRACRYYYTEILTTVAGEPVVAYNIGGSTCVAMDDLARYFGAEYTWLEGERQLHLHVHADGKARTGAWSFTYETPDYDRNTPVSGEDAVWEFTKNEAGEFVLTYSAGTTAFTPRLTFGSDSMSFSVHMEEKRLRGGALVATAAPHSIDVLDKIQPLPDSDEGYWGTALTAHDGVTKLCADDYRNYCTIRPAYAEWIRGSEKGEAYRVWRVYYNGERVHGVALSRNSMYYSIDSSADAWIYDYQYDRLYPLDEVKQVRVELTEKRDLWDSTTVAHPDAAFPIENAGEIPAGMSTVYYVLPDGSIRVRICSDKDGVPHLVRIDSGDDFLFFADPLPLKPDSGWLWEADNTGILFSHPDWENGTRYRIEKAKMDTPGSITPVP